MLGTASVCSTSRPLLVHHVARRLGVSPRTVRYWAKNGQLPARKIGPKIWTFRVEDVEAFGKRTSRTCDRL